MQILTLLPKVAKEIGAIAKSRENEQQKYKFRGIDEALDAIHLPLCNNGVVPVPEVFDVTREERTSSKGGLLIYTNLKLKLTWTASDGSSIVTVTAGEAMDSADKSTNKATSAAFKYACFLLFSIPLGEKDADATTPDPDPKAPPEKPKPEPKKPAKSTDPKPQAPKKTPVADCLKAVLHELKCLSPDSADAVIRYATGGQLMLDDCRGSEGNSETARCDIEGHLGGIMANPPGCTRAEACDILYANAIQQVDK